MENFNQPITATSIRIGEVRFSYVYVFSPRKNEDGTDGKYSVQILIPKTDAQAKKLIDAAIEAAKQAGVASRWNGKMPPASKLHIPLRDGDEEYPGDDTYRGMWFMNASSKTRPAVMVRSNGQMSNALDMDDFYSGCWGAAVLNFRAFSNSGNVGISAYVNALIKTRDDESLAGGISAERAFGDMVSGSVLD